MTVSKLTLFVHVHVAVAVVYIDGWNPFCLAYSHESFAFRFAFPFPPVRCHCFSSTLDCILVWFVSHGSHRQSCTLSLPKSLVLSSPTPKARYLCFLLLVIQTVANLSMESDQSLLERLHPRSSLPVLVLDGYVVCFLSHCCFFYPVMLRPTQHIVSNSLLSLLFIIGWGQWGR